MPIFWQSTLKAFYFCQKYAHSIYVCKLSMEVTQNTKNCADNEVCAVLPKLQELKIILKC